MWKDDGSVGMSKVNNSASGLLEPLISFGVEHIASLGISVLLVVLWTFGSPIMELCNSSVCIVDRGSRLCVPFSEVDASVVPLLFDLL